MAEGNRSGGPRRRRLVEPESTHATSESSMTVVPLHRAATPELSAGVSPWGTILTVRFPAGTVRHPRVLDRVEREIGRACAVDTEDEGVRVSYGTRGESLEAAHHDSCGVAGHLLSVLGLQPAAVVEHQILVRPDSEVAAAAPHLLSSQDLHSCLG